jgi:glutamate dehydrogenase (NADP+)
MSYVAQVISNTEAKNPGQSEFLQTVNEVLTSIEPLVASNEALYRKHAILERMVEPDRQIIFRVPWMDDKGETHVNRGFRIQFNNAIGPYKGGLRFHPSVDLSIMKFLAFEQTFKNSLTGLPMGGAKGGADFDPKGKSDDEVMRFCQSFISELYRHIGSNTDIPAGDIGVGSREIGYLFGAYKKIRGAYDNGVLTGKNLSYGGSLIRPEATGYGAVYFLEEIFNFLGDTINGKTFALSGYGNATWGSCLKIVDMGGKVVSISGSAGYVYDADGVYGEKIDYLLKMRAEGKTLKDYADKFGAKFVAGEQPWGKVHANVYMPCATQNEIGINEAKFMVENGVKALCEVANMPTSNEALAYLIKNGVIVAPAKAANAGGVAVSGLEMSQNSIRLFWTKEEVDQKLRGIMKNIHKQILDALNEFDLPYNLVAGANIAGFKKVSEAMISQGIF